MPVKEDDDGGDVPAKEDHDEIEDTPIGETKKTSKKRRRRRRKKNKKRK